MSDIKIEQPNTEITTPETTDSGNQKSVWAGGNDNYEHIWDNRASLTYT